MREHLEISGGGRFAHYFEPYGPPARMEPAVGGAEVGLLEATQLSEDHPLRKMAKRTRPETLTILGALATLLLARFRREGPPSESLEAGQVGQGGNVLSTARPGLLDR